VIEYKRGFLAALFNRLQNSLKKTREGVFNKLTRIFLARKKIDQDTLGEIEEILLSGDVGVETTLYLLDRIKERVKAEGFQDSGELEALMQHELSALLQGPGQEQAEPGLKIILVVGVNGTGKTTSIAKLAHHYQKQGKRVLLAAGDTFRAAAIEQLTVWAERLGCEIIRHQPNADPSAVVFDAITAARARNMDYLIIDTAGRLHTKSNLMSELNKIYRVIQKNAEHAPHEVILVVDASTGQNAVNQAREFKNAARVDTIFLSKLDGTAKGGVLLAINKELNIPVRYIGTGEKIEDMATFDPQTFITGLFLRE
jgi:fused signal recognition particle receptor